MKAYLALTALLFGLLTVLHIWRAIVEPEARNPWMIGIAVLAAVLCGWALVLWRKATPATEQSK